MSCPRCGADMTGTRCTYCGMTSAGGSAGPEAGGFAQPPAGNADWQAAMGQPTSQSPEYRAAMGQPTANDAEYRAAMGQPTASDPNYQAAMGQPPGMYAPPPGQGMMGPQSTQMAKKGCCGCLSVMMLASAVGIATLLTALLVA